MECPETVAENMAESVLQHKHHMKMSAFRTMFTYKKTGVKVFLSAILIFTACANAAMKNSHVNLKKWKVECSSKDSSADCRTLISIIDKYNQAELNSTRIRSVLDSLGFSHSVTDSINRICTPGPRAVITGERIIITDTSFNKFSRTVTYPCPFDAGAIENRAVYLGRICAENGFPFASVTTEMNRLNQYSLTDTLAVIYTINTDVHTRFASPRFRTFKKTSPALLRHYIDIKDSAVFDIRKIESSAKKLRTSAVVADVKILEPLLLSDTITSDSSALATVPFEIQDRSGLAFEGAVGFESDEENRPSLRGSATFSLLNMFHRAEALSFQYKGSDSLQMFNVIVSKPYPFNLPFQIKTTCGMEVETDNYGYIYGDLRLFAAFNTYWLCGFGIAANETSQDIDTINSESRYLGLNFLLSRTSGEYAKGSFYNNMSFVIGSGIAKKEKDYSRSNVNFNIATHIPVFRSEAFSAKLTTAHIVTDETTLLSAEMNRIGGHESLRGYTDNAFAFRTVIYGQGEIIHYFGSTSSIYILFDAGIGFTGDIDIDKKSWTKMIGYGAGIRIPSRLGLVTIEWARNYQDKKSLGRVHLQFKNELSSLTEKFL